MTSDEHAHMQELEGLVKRYRSKIVEMKGAAVSDIKREMTLGEIVAALPEGHRAKQELKALREAASRLADGTRYADPNVAEKMRHYAGSLSTPPASPAATSAAFTDAQIETYANLRLSLQCEQTNGRDRDWSDTAILMARQLQQFSAAERPAPTWQPIESVPKGQYVLVWCGMVTVALFHEADGGTWLFQCEKLKTNPSHWMPLPAAPRSVVAPEKE